MAHTLPLAQQVILLVGNFDRVLASKFPSCPFIRGCLMPMWKRQPRFLYFWQGVLLKLGTYGLLRFGLGLFPDAWQLLAPGLAFWAAIGSLYGALLAIAQTDMKKMVAYSSIAHMSYILLAGGCSHSPKCGGIHLTNGQPWFNFGASYFCWCGVVYLKTGTRNLEVLRGLLNPERGLPLIGSMMVLGVMASAGIPGMVGFIAEFLVFRGSFPIFPIPTLLCMVSTGLTAVYFLLLVNRAFFWASCGWRQTDRCTTGPKPFPL